MASHTEELYYNDDYSGESVFPVPRQQWKDPSRHYRVMSTICDCGVFAAIKAVTEGQFDAL